MLGRLNPLMTGGGAAPPSLNQLSPYLGGALGQVMAAPVPGLQQALSMLQQYYAQKPPADPDAPWVQQLKQMVQPYVDPRMELSSPQATTDPGLNRTGPQVGGIIGT